MNMTYINPIQKNTPTLLYSNFINIHNYTIRPSRVYQNIYHHYYYTHN